jgi:hypothetical protein
VRGWENPLKGMGGWRQRKATLIIMMALALTLTVGTVAIGAPKEKRTICTPEGKTMEVPAHSKGHKGATEGPCQETPPPPPDPENPDLEQATRICETQYGGTIVSTDPITCEYTGDTGVALETAYLNYDGVYRIVWEEVVPDNFGFPTLVSYELRSCQSTLRDGPLFLDDPRCAYDPFNP